MNILRWSRISIVLFLSLCVLSPGKVADGQTVAADNVLTVRAIYQKLSNAIQMQQLRELVLSSKPASPDEATTPPSIILSDIVAGNVSDILNTSYADLVTKPSGAVLAVSPGVWRYTLKNGQQSTAEIASADWTTEPYLAEDWIQPMERVIAQGSIDSSYVSYVSAAVSLSYAGAARQYKALFLFGPGTGSQPKVLPLDQIIGVSQLLAILNAPSTPDPLAYEPFHSRPTHSDFLQDCRPLRPVPVTLARTFAVLLQPANVGWRRAISRCTGLTVSPR
jgi:hypothetical protein